MVGKVIELNAESFDDFVSEGERVIDFWAAWCAPCKILSPIVEELAGEMKKVKFGKVDVDKYGELAQRFQILSIPTLLYFKDGEQVNRTSGAIPKEELKKEIDGSF